MMNMYVMLMIMFWNVNACLTPRGVTSTISKSQATTVLPGISSTELDPYIEYVHRQVPRAPRSTSKRARADDTSISASVVKKSHQPSTLPGTQVVGSMLLGEYINMLCLLYCLFASLTEYFLFSQLILWLICSMVKRMMMRPSTHVDELLLHPFLFPYYS
jgi:hypothetical protein